MTTKPKCGGCQHYAPAIKNHPDKGGACRRDPPVPYIVGSDQFSRPRTVSVWPTVGSVDWCSRFVERVGEFIAGPEEISPIPDGPSETPLKSSRLILPGNSNGSGNA